MNFTIDWPASNQSRAATTPLWHPDEACLYWTDGTTLFRFNPASGVNETVYSSDTPIGAMTLQTDGSILLLRDGANVAVFKDGQATPLPIRHAADDDFSRSHFAGAAADSRGRVLCAVLSDAHHTGRIAMLDTDGRLETLADGFFVPGGIAFDDTSSRLYFTDSHVTRMRTHVFDYDADLGDLGDGRIFHDAIAHDDGFGGVPSGIAIDEDAFVWIARCGGSLIVRHAPSGEITDSVHVDVRRPHGIAFGGAGMDEIYMTTLGGQLRVSEGLHAGDLGRVRGITAKGAAPFRSRIGEAKAEAGQEE